MPDEAEVFGPLAEDYARYRPGYPAEALDVLAQVCRLTRDWVIADIGCGTGNLARLFLAAGHQVVGIEPNREMREAGERLLAGYPAFRSIDGAAEHIPLDAQSVEMVTVGQALHWFDINQARAEFRRILRPGGWVAVLWNDRRSGATAFTQEYDAITSTLAGLHPPPGSAAPVGHLFGGVTPNEASFPHTQRFDLDGFLGRARSSGFIPQPGTPNHASITALMTDLFNRHQDGGMVEYHYVARLFCGRLEGQHP